MGIDPEHPPDRSGTGHDKTVTAVAPNAVSPPPPRKRPNWDRFIGIVGLLLGALLFVLQANGVEMNWGLSLALYALIAVGLVWSCLRHAVPHLGLRGRYIAALSVFALVAFLGSIGTVKQYRREHMSRESPQSSPSAAPVAPAPSQPSNQPSEPAPKSKVPPNLTTEDLEVLDFDSIQGITLHNGYDGTVIVLGIVSTLTVPEGLSSSTNQELEIGPNRTQQFIFNDPGKSFQIHSIKPLADTWEGQMAEAEKAFYGCVFPLFLSSDSFQMKQVVDHYMQTLGSPLPVGDATGEITYRIGPKTKTKKFPLKVIASAIEGCVPKQH